VYLPGPSLQYAVAEFGPLPVTTVRTLAAGLAEVLIAVHADGIVHRDLKPSNVLLAEDGPRVIDFGISRAMEGTALTRTGLLVGSPGFMSPEQVRGGKAGPPADIFGLGATLAFALTGHGPFGGGTPHAVLYRVVTEQPDLAGLPSDLYDLLAGCMDKDPAVRPTARQVLERITGTVAAAPSAPGWLPDPVQTLVLETAAALRSLPGAAPGPQPRASAHRADPAQQARQHERPAAPPPQTAAVPPQPAAPQPAGHQAANPYAAAPAGHQAANPYAAAPTGPPGHARGQGLAPYRYGAKPWPRNGLGTASLIFGLLGIVCFFGPGVLLGALGILLGIGGIRRANRGAATNRGVAIAGVLISLVAMLLSLSVLADAARTAAACQKAGSARAAPDRCPVKP
jgi:hypothetical protein